MLKKYLTNQGKYYKMEHYKISKLLNYSTASKFVTKTSIEVNDLSGSQYSVNKNIKFKTPAVRSCLRDYSNAYILEKGAINLKADENDDMRRKIYCT